MNKLVRETLNLEQYQCRSCKRLFYINGIERSELDLDFGCPFGCNDSGKYVREIVVEIKGVLEKDT
jgi:hypothetical protein